VLKSLTNILKIPELRKKILITIGLVAVYRLGCFIPTPGVDGTALSNFFEELAKRQASNLLGFVNIFTGGALHRLSVFALGVMPYISASIIMQLLTAVIPALEKLAKEGKAGYEKINQFTRYLTLALCCLQGFFLSLWLENREAFFGMTIVPYPGWGFRLGTVITLACGTLLVMWLGEQIQERGIGSGISLIITAGIISRFPESIYQIHVLFTQGTLPAYQLISLIVLWVAVICAVVLFSQAQRKVPIQYARRVVGRKVYGGQATFLPIKVDMSGVIAIIFAGSVLAFPGTIAMLFQKSGWLQKVALFFQEQGVLYNIIYVLLIMFFMYFYTAMVFNPVEIAQNLKKHGGFVPGVRPGEKTAEYLDKVTSRLVFAGAVYIALIAILPVLIMGIFNIRSYTVAEFFGGTTILIFVGVMLDTMRQIESQLILHHYDGFMKGGRLKGRRSFSM